ncbi:MAG TPA: methylmalonyl Co-A mutase-associated GTPase MeaB [Myxococcaceae bacterium]|nr:methylmalonyl Co-A mutase-associated GTPase MeaB [Myxococcaceae bacterium]
MTQEWAKKIAAGDTRALARAATAIENREPGAEQLLMELQSQTASRPLVLGVTGAPGAGKSTLVDRLAGAFRKQGKTVAIIAVDPSSALTGGALLGDRIRMQAHHADSGIFIRSMATRGALGGLANSTAGLVRLFGAAGRDVVIVETVGVGQAEVAVAQLATVTLVVLAPGMGDDVQAFKAGIMEIADIYVINKADHPGAAQVESEIRSLQSVGHRADGWIPPIVRTVATDGTGIDALMAAVERARGMEKRPAATGRLRIDHLGVAVKSIDEALAFYEGQLGMPVASRETVEQEKVNVAMLPAGGPRLELLEPTEADSVIGRFLQKRGEGLHHVALRVPDLAVAVERLKSGGARILNEPRQGAGGHEYVFVHPSSTGGVLLELIQDSEG